MRDVFDASHDPAFIANAVKKCVTESNKNGQRYCQQHSARFSLRFSHTFITKNFDFPLLAFFDRFPALKKRLARVEIKSKF